MKMNVTLKNFLTIGSTMVLTIGLCFLIFSLIFTPPPPHCNLIDGIRKMKLVTDIPNSVLLVNYVGKNIYCKLDPCGTDCYELENNKIFEVYITSISYFDSVKDKDCIKNTDATEANGIKLTCTSFGTVNNTDIFDPNGYTLYTSWEKYVTPQQISKVFKIPPPTDYIKIQAIEMSDKSDYEGILLIPKGFYSQFNISALDIKYVNNSIDHYSDTTKSREFILKKEIDTLIVYAKNYNEWGSQVGSIPGRRTGVRRKPINSHPRFKFIHQIDLGRKGYTELLEIKP